MNAWYKAATKANATYFYSKPVFLSNPGKPWNMLCVFMLPLNEILIFKRVPFITACLQHKIWATVYFQNHKSTVKAHARESLAVRWLIFIFAWMRYLVVRNTGSDAGLLEALLHNSPHQSIPSGICMYPGPSSSGAAMSFTSVTS